MLYMLVQEQNLHFHDIDKRRTKEELTTTNLCALLSTQWNIGDIGEKADQEQWEGWWAQQGELKRFTNVSCSVAPA